MNNKFNLHSKSLLKEQVSKNLVSPVVQLVEQRILIPHVTRSSRVGAALNKLALSFLDSAFLYKIQKKTRILAEKA